MWAIAVQPQDENLIFLLLITPRTSLHPPQVLPIRAVTAVHLGGTDCSLRRSTTPLRMKLEDDQGVPLEAIQKDAGRTHMPNSAKQKISRISIDDVKKRLDEVVFVDARSATALSRNPMQVPGAIHVPAKDIANGLKRLPRNKTLVTYCT